MTDMTDMPSTVTMRIGREVSPEAPPLLLLGISAAKPPAEGAAMTTMSTMPLPATRGIWPAAKY
jgi:hypothetical protein